MGQSTKFSEEILMGFNRNRYGGAPKKVTLAVCQATPRQELVMRIEHALHAAEASNNKDDLVEMLYLLDMNEINELSFELYQRLSALVSRYCQQAA
jgi:hypothetical protein